MFHIDIFTREHDSEVDMIIVTTKFPCIARERLPGNNKKFLIMTIFQRKMINSRMELIILHAKPTILATCFICVSMGTMTCCFCTKNNWRIGSLSLPGTWRKKRDQRKQRNWRNKETNCQMHVHGARTCFAFTCRPCPCPGTFLREGDIGKGRYWGLWEPALSKGALGRIEWKTGKRSIQGKFLRDRGGGASQEGCDLNWGKREVRVMDCDI
jgi:hypothetical protein